MEYNSNQSYIEKRSSGMAVASLVIGIFGVVTGLCPYSGYIFGSLAIIFGLLSRGGEMTMNSQAKAGVILGCIGIALSTLVILIAIGLGISGRFNYFTDYNISDYNFDNYHFDSHDFDDYNYNFDNHHFDDSNHYF